MDSESPDKPLQSRLGHAICGAKTRSGGLCANFPLPGGNGRCRMHGGRARKGAAHPNYQGKGFSKHLPTAIADLYREAESDPDLVSHRATLSLFFTRARMLASRLHSGESGSLWKRLTSHWSDFESAQKAAAEATAADDPVARQSAAEAAQSALKSIGKVIRDGNNDEEAWDELLEIVDRGSQVASREQARLRDMHQMMTAEQVLLLFGNVYQAVIDEVKDRAVQAKIGVKLGQLMNLPDRSGKTVDAVSPLPPE